MNWERLGKVFAAWSGVVDGSRSVYVQERRGEWFIYFRVSRSKGLMLADKTVQDCISGDDLNQCADTEELGRTLGEEMSGRFTEKV